MKYRIIQGKLSDYDWNPSGPDPLPALNPRGADTTKFYTLPPVKTEQGYQLSRSNRAYGTAFRYYARPDAIAAHVLDQQSRHNLAMFASLAKPKPLDELTQLAMDATPKQAQYLEKQDELHTGRHLFSFLHADPEAVRRLCIRNVRHAMKPEDPEFAKEAVSPLLVPYLLGGMSLAAFEEGALKVLTDVLDTYMELPPLKRGSYLRESALMCGFGAWLPHLADDAPSLINFTRWVNEDDKAYIRRIKDHPLPKAAKPASTNLNSAQQFLIGLPPGPYANALYSGGAYGGEVKLLVASVKGDACRDAAIALALGGGSITDTVAKQMRKTLGEGYEKATEISDRTWLAAVNRVFCRPWRQLNLKCQPTASTVKSDAEMVLARAIISKLSVKLRLPAAGVKLPGQLVAIMSLLTGVSVMSFLRFVEMDFYRRGECIMGPDEVDAIDGVFFSTDALQDALSDVGSATVNTFSEQLSVYRNKFARFADQSEYEGASQFAQRLRSTKDLMWNYPVRDPQASYHYLGVDARKAKLADPEDSGVGLGIYRFKLNERFAEYANPDGKTPFHDMTRWISVN